MNLEDYNNCYIDDITMNELAGDLISNDEDSEIEFLSYLFGKALVYDFCDEGCGGKWYDEKVDKINTEIAKFDKGKKYFKFQERC